MNKVLHELKNKHLIWQASEQQTQALEPITSGYPLIDRQLQGGWPPSGVIEIHPEHIGIGELRLILPCISQLGTKNKLQAWVNPPAHLTPHNLNINSLKQTLIVSPTKAREHCWVVEQLLTSACCSCLVFWTSQLDATQAKRLQLAAKESQTLAFVICTQPVSKQSLALSLRMKLQANAHGLRLDIFKRQNAWPIEPFDVDLSPHWPQLFKNEQAGLTQAAVGHNIIPFPHIEAHK